MKRLLTKVAPYLFVALAVLAALFAVSRNAGPVRSALEHLGIVVVLVAIVFAVLAGITTYLSWRTLLLGMGAPASIRDTARVFFVSQLGKYLPGSVWPVVAQMEYGRRNNISRPTMLAANVFTIVINLAVGLMVAACTLPFSGRGALGEFWWTFLFLPPLVALLHPAVLPTLLNWALRRIGRAQVEATLPMRAIGLAAILSLGSWGLYGLHLYTLVGGLGIHGWATAAASVGGFALAVCAGILFIPAPAGAGVRDAVLIAALAASMTGGTALAIGLVSRVLLVAVDLLLALAVTVLARRRAPTRSVI